MLCNASSAVQISTRINNVHICANPANYSATETEFNSADGRDNGKTSLGLVAISERISI